ncbi:MAG: methionyl-tRNA formyltransferase [Pseudomonadaceae bacterium]|nr:methionyl-tRNA formyltransferase [Pseudomonadaceae bacterium]
MPELKTVFAGSPEFAARILARMIDSPFTPAAVFTQPDRPTGRGRKVRPNAVKQLAETAGIELFQPKSLRDKTAQNLLENQQADVFVVAAYGLILPQAVLDIPRFGCLNVHASLLPRWRGAAPIERAVMAGDKQTGVCIMQMQAGLDTGPVFAQTEIPITADTTALALTQVLADAGGDLLIEVLASFARAKTKKRKLPTPTAQDDNLATYAHKLEASDRSVDWRESAQSIADKIRALAGRMPVRTLLGEVHVQILQAHAVQQNLPDTEATPAGTLIDVSRSGIIVQCETDLLQITRVKVERGKGSELDPAAAINGYSDLFFPGARFAN